MVRVEMVEVCGITGIWLKQNFRVGERNIKANYNNFIDLRERGNIAHTTTATIIIIIFLRFPFAFTAYLYACGYVCIICG